MAAVRRGRIAYIDSPGTYVGLWEDGFTLCYAHLLTDGVHDARLAIFAGTEIDPQALLFDSVVPGSDWQCDWGRGRSEETVSDAKVVTAVLLGEGARALIYAA